MIERYGHCSDGLVGLVRLIAGAGHSEPWETDYSSAAPSRVTHVAQCVVFGAVMADAAMLDAALEMDAWGRERWGWASGLIWERACTCGAVLFCLVFLWSCDVTCPCCITRFAVFKVL